MTRTASTQSLAGADRATPPGGSVDGGSPMGGKRASDNAGGRAARAHPAQGTKPRTTASGGGDGLDDHGRQQPDGGADGAPKDRTDSGITWRVFRGNTSSTASNKGGENTNNNRRGKGFGRNTRILPSEGGFGGNAREGEAVTAPLVPPDQHALSTDLTAATPTGGGH